MHAHRGRQVVSILVVFAVLAPGGVLAGGIFGGYVAGAGLGPAAGSTVQAPLVPAIGPAATAAHAPVSFGPPPPCTVTVSGENPGHNAVQTAINGAAANAVICLAAGVYPEQLNISVAGLTLRGAGNSSTFIEPSGTLALNAKDVDRAALTPAWTIVLVYDAPNVRLENLQVSGALAQATFSNLNGCPSDLYFGVTFQDSSGTINGSTVSNIELPTNLFGCQPGVDVFAYNGALRTHVVPSPAVVVNVTNSSLVSYDKNGMTCDDPGEMCVVASSAVTGVGPTTLIAQNGIQISFGASGTITNDSLTGNHYTGVLGHPTDANYFSDATGTGVLVYDPGNSVSVSGNALSGDDIGIAAAGSEQATVSSNTISQAFDYGITFDLNASLNWLGYPLYGTDGTWQSVASNNAISHVNVGILSYDDNVTISGGTMSEVNVSIESVVDLPGPAYTLEVDHLTAQANVSGVLLGNLSNFQTTPGVQPKTLGTYGLNADIFTAGSVSPPTGAQYGMLLNGSTVWVSNSSVSGFVQGIVVSPGATSTSVEYTSVVTPAGYAMPVVGIWAGDQAFDPTNTTTGSVVIQLNTVTGPGGATDSPLAGSAGIIAGGLHVVISGNEVDDFSAVYGSTPTNITGPGSGYDWWEGTQSVGVLMACAPAATLASCRVDNNTLNHNTIGLTVILTNAAFGGTWETGPVSIEHNWINESGGYAIYTSMGGRGAGAPHTSHIDNNFVNNTVTGAPALDLAGQSYNVYDNVFIGTSASGNQGPVQGEGGASITTASVQLTDYWDYGYGWTTAALHENVFEDTSLYCSTSLAGGSLSSLSCGELVTFSETGLLGSATWSVTVGSVSGSVAAPSTIVVGLQNGSAPFSVASVPGYTEAPPSGLVVVAGAPVAEPIVFTPPVQFYAVTFAETGLPPSALWYVNVSGGVTGSSTTTTIVLNEPNGSYTFTATPSDHRYPAVSGGLVVDGLGGVVPVTFELGAYAVVFTETGVPAGHRWWLNLSDAESFSSTTNMISFSEPNGTYNYTFGATPVFPKYYSASPGSFTVNGAEVTRSAVFVQERQVKITETGLPTGMRWWANFTGTYTFTTTGSVLVLYVPAGSWTYTLEAANHSYAAHGGHFPVSNPLAHPHVALQYSTHFHLVKYRVTVTESGLPTGAHWCVVIAGGPTVCSAGTSAALMETNGTYHYTLTTGRAGYSAPAGSYTVTGGPKSIAVTFT